MHGIEEIKAEYNRMTALKFKGQRVYTNEYIIKTLSFRCSISPKRIKLILSELTTSEPRPHLQNHTKTRLCKCCGLDISHKQRNAIFCNKRCKEKNRNLGKKANKQSF